MGSNVGPMDPKNPQKESLGGRVKNGIPLDRLGIRKLKANLAQSNLLTKLSHGVMRVNFMFGGDS